MHLIIQGRHLPVTPAINSYVKNKLKKTTDHFDGIIHAHVVLESVKGQQSVEVTITSGHHHFHNKIATEDLYKSIDVLFDKVERQVRRYKEFQTDKLQKQEKLTFHLQEVSDVVETSNIKIEDVEISSKPMNDLEAALQLNVDSDSFVMGYLPDFDHERPHYLEKSTPNQYNLISFEDYWEMKEVELVNQNKLEVNSVKSLKVPYDSIEHAIDFLNHNDEEKFRFFISVRTGRSMLLHKIGKDHFALVRETI